jgi:hypothetical protein
MASRFGVSSGDGFISGKGPDKEFGELKKSEHTPWETQKSSHDGDMKSLQT